MTSDSTSGSSQGLLDLSVELSTVDITAGKEFTIFVLVKNPFSKPVWIQEVNVSLPSELKRLDDQEIQQRAKDAEEKQKQLAQEKKQEQIKLQSDIANLQAAIDGILTELKSKPESAFSQEIDSLNRKIDRMSEKLNELNVGESDIRIVGKADIGNIKIGSQSSSLKLDADNRGKSTSNQITINQIEVYEPWLIYEQEAQSRTVSLKSSLPINTALLPGSTAVYTVILNVKRSLIFTPTKYRLQFYVNYGFESGESAQANNHLSLNENLYTNTIAHSISIRPSVYSVITGSVIGAAIGAIARLLQTSATPSLSSFIISLVLSTILGGMAIIFMARKSDTQSFVSVEDFWGGMLIGFLVGYTGTSFFESISGVAPPA